jgi:cardiolipin synthase (CMP-forming)
MVLAEPPAMSDRASASFINPLRAAPNLLTLARICLAPFLVMAVLDGHFAAGLALFIVAGLTDAFDGLLARLLKQRTALGQYLDPVADKLLLSTLFVVLTHKGLIPTRVTVMVFSRDVIILVVAAILYASVGRREFKPSILGKANTVVQILAIAAVLLAQVDGMQWVGQLRLIALDATMALTILSGLHYAWIASHKTPHAAANGADAQSKN